MGIGFPSSVDDKNGVVIYTANINLNNAPVVEELKKYIDKPIYIGNDANCAALGEFFALNDESIENFVAITLGTGVGGGIIINKTLDNYIKYIAEGIIDIINIFQPDCVAVGGGISRQGDNLLNPIKEYIKGKTFGASYIKETKITIAKLGNDAGIVGAAFLAK